MTKCGVIEGYRARSLPWNRVKLELTRAQVQELLCYDPLSGSLTWKPRPLSMFNDESAFHKWNRKYAGADAFTSIRNGGYRCGRILGRYYLAHKVVWFLHYGSWPQSRITFENGDRADIRISNLKAKGESAQ